MTQEHKEKPLTDKEVEQLRTDVFDDISLNIETEKKRASMSDRDLILSQSRFPIESPQHKIYENDLKTRHLNQQHALNKIIQKKQHELNLKILSEQQIFNKKLSDNSNKTMVKAAIAGAVSGAIVASILTLVINIQTSQTNDTELRKSQVKIEKTK